MDQQALFGIDMEMCLLLRKLTGYPELLIKTKDIVQELGYDLVYADTDFVFIKRTDSARDYSEVINALSKKTCLSISVDYHYKFLVLLPLEADEKIEVLKHYLELLLITS